MNFNNPSLTFTLALAAGVLAQAFAARLRVPGIVLLLVTGVLLGPEVAGVIRPQALGRGLSHVVGLSVAVILFEGGLSLSVERLRGEAVVIRRLILSGALLTASLSAIAAHFILHWTWPISVLFGTLVSVTGPTVIMPLLKRIRVNANVATILEAEAVLIDPIGAIVAVVALEIVLAESTGGAARHLMGLPTRLLLGIAMGLAGGIIIARLLKSNRLIPDGLENIVTLALVLALHEISDAVQPESGILAVTVAGLIVGNVRTRITRELREFKEQLTIMLVGALFILLAADVALKDVIGLGWQGVAMVTVLMLIIRPLNILASTRGSTLTWKDRAFLAWISPRGIVAAAVASIFARRLTEAGRPVGDQFVAMVFLVIAVTVVIQGMSGGMVAEKLGIRRRSNSGFIVVGANALGRWVARVLTTNGNDVIVIDSNVSDTQTAAGSGLSVLSGNAHDEKILESADIEGRRGFIAVTSNASVNLVLAQRARRRFHVGRTYAAIRSGPAPVTVERAEEAGVLVMFGESLDIPQWIAAAEVPGMLTELRWVNQGALPLAVRDAIQAASPTGGRPVLPVASIHRGVATPVDENTILQAHDELVLLCSSAG